MDVTWSKSVTVEAFRPLYESKSLINLIWGGRDAAKTHNIGDILVYKCLSQPYFKCILTRAVQGTIRGSLYSVIVNSIKRHGLDSLFDWIGNPMEIRCKNGNMFVGIGADDPQKIKSTDNPTDVWCEEADQLKMDAIDIILTSLRSNEVKAQGWFTLNPEVNEKTGSCDILKRFIPDYEDNIHDYYSDSNDCKLVEWSQFIDIEIKGKKHTEEIKLLSLHVLADHNPYATPARIALYESYKEVDENKYNVWRWGKLGFKQNDKPFFKFSETNNLQYLDEPFTPSKKLPILIAFDFNYDPCTAILMQFNNGVNRDVDIPVGLHIYKTIQITGGTIPLCDELLILGIDRHPALIDVTGDNSARQKRSNSFQTDKAIVEDKLMTTFRTHRKVNEEHKNSMIICNYWLVFGKTYIYKENNAPLINDLKTAEIDEKGGLRKDRDKHKQDSGDAFRYGIHYFIGRTVDDVQTTIDLIKMNHDYEEIDDEPMGGVDIKELRKSF